MLLARDRGRSVLLAAGRGRAVGPQGLLVLLDPNVRPACGLVSRSSPPPAARPPLRFTRGTVSDARVSGILRESDCCDRPISLSITRPGASLVSVSAEFSFLFFLLFNDGLGFHCSTHRVSFTHSSFDGPLGCFRILIIVDAAAANVAVLTPPEDLAPMLLDECARAGLLERTVLLAAGASPGRFPRPESARGPRVSARRRHELPPVPARGVLTARPEGSLRL